jgi:hypothetical protein
MGILQDHRLDPVGRDRGIQVHHPAEAPQVRLFHPPTRDDPGGGRSAGAQIRGLGVQQLDHQAIR